MDDIRITGIIFSRDRAMQLCAGVQSFYLNCQDAQQVDLHVIYKTTTSLHARTYVRLIEDFSVYPGLHFLPETRLRQDLLSLLVNSSEMAQARKKMISGALRLPHRTSLIANPLIQASPRSYVLFLVDDNLFVRQFCLAEVIETLEAEADLLGFSLRLGRNTGFCYTANRRQALPEFIPLRPGIVKFNWSLAEFDFHYPLEISSSVYRLDQVFPLLNSLNFKTPNQLESRMAARAHVFRESRPYLACFERSVAFCNPVNVVQQDVPNSSGQKIAYTSQWLAKKYEAGCRVDVKAYQDFTPESCHQETELIFEEKAA